MTTQTITLMSFLDELAAARIHHHLGHHLDGAVTVEVAVPCARWEVDFYQDGRVDVEVFRGDGTISDASILHELVESHGS